MIEAAYDDATDAAMAAARALSPSAVRALERIGGGGNNRIFRVDTDAGPFALKIYRDPAADRRDRMGNETRALAFLDGRVAGRVPRPVAHDPAVRAALIEWIGGGPIADPGHADINAAIDFVAALRSASGAAEAATLGAATEACLSAAEIVRQVENRYQRLQAAAAAEIELARFLDADAAPVLARAVSRARQGYAEAGLDFSADIGAGERVLSPSDFGFHNALRRAGGGVVFIDFEYFGWDDPVRLVADFLLHPGMRLDAGARRRFRDGTAAVFAGDGGFELRLQLLYPLVGLRWCMILLNEFLPEKWVARRFAGAAETAAEAQRRQLDKARGMLARADAALNGVTDD